MSRSSFANCTQVLKHYCDYHSSNKLGKDGYRTSGNALFRKVLADGEVAGLILFSHQDAPAADGLQAESKTADALQQYSTWIVQCIA